MSKPYGIFRAKCCHPGCEEFTRYEAYDRKHYIELERSYGYGKYRCVRHSQPGHVLSADNSKIVDEMTIFDQPNGRYWGKEKAWNGFAHGPGFKAFAEDFPAGTILRITAEVIIPDAGRSSLADEGKP